MLGILRERIAPCQLNIFRWLLTRIHRRRLLNTEGNVVRAQDVWTGRPFGARKWYRVV